MDIKDLQQRSIILEIKKTSIFTSMATDIARGPDGKMWVIKDKTQAPSGLGYAIENRLTMNVISKDLYPNIKINRTLFFYSRI